ncbi:hypothetical protein CR513_50810, partial [Mucuna pruriens]
MCFGKNLKLPSGKKSRIKEGDHSILGYPHADEAYSPVLLSSPRGLKPLSIFYPTYVPSLATSRKEALVMNSPGAQEKTEPSPPQLGESSRSGPISNNPLKHSPIRSSPIASAMSAIQHKGYLSSSSTAMSFLEKLAAQLGIEKPKVTRGDRLDYQHILVDLILSVLASEIAVDHGDHRGRWNHRIQALRLKTSLSGYPQPGYANEPPPHGARDPPYGMPYGWRTETPAVEEHEQQDVANNEGAKVVLNIGSRAEPSHEDSTKGRII